MHTTLKKRRVIRTF